MRFQFGAALPEDEADRTSTEVGIDIWIERSGRLCGSFCDDDCGRAIIGKCGRKETRALARASGNAVIRMLSAMLMNAKRKTFLDALRMPLFSLRRSWRTISHVAPLSKAEKLFHDFDWASNSLPEQICDVIARGWNVSGSPGVG